MKHRLYKHGRHNQAWCRNPDTKFRCRLRLCKEAHLPRRMPKLQFCRRLYRRSF